jgi:hypothetical protein
MRVLPRGLPLAVGSDLYLVMGTTAAASLGMPGGSNGTIAAARQRTQIRQRVRHSDTNSVNACTDARITSPTSRRYCHAMWNRAWR